MNLVETEFFNTYHAWTSKISDAANLLTPQAVIGKYRADFLYNNRYVIEIDGKCFHEGQLQMQKDYERERYLLSNGYKVIRFTGAEVRKNARQCITQMMEVIYSLANVKEDYLAKNG
jgi:very-short-patch-repair endonuclease